MYHQIHVVGRPVLPPQSAHHVQMGCHRGPCQTVEFPVTRQLLELPRTGALLSTLADCRPVCLHSNNTNKTCYTTAALSVSHSGWIPCSNCATTVFLGHKLHSSYLHTLSSRYLESLFNQVDDASFTQFRHVASNPKAMQF